MDHNVKWFPLFYVMYKMIQFFLHLPQWLLQPNFIMPNMLPMASTNRSLNKSTRVVLVWKCNLFHSQRTSHFFYFSLNTFYFYSKSPFLSLWLNTIIKYFIEFKHRHVILTGSTSPDLHLCWRTRTLNFIIILCTLLFWYFTSPPSAFLLFLHTYDRSHWPEAFSEDQTVGSSINAWDVCTEGSSCICK